MSLNTASHAVEEEHGHGHAHASDKFYYFIAIVLAVITLAEVLYPFATEDIPFLAPFFMPLLGIMSLAKFAIVVAYFMHLRYDHNILTWILVFSMSVAVVIITALILLMLI